jgi:hypothetical protein
MYNIPRMYRLSHASQLSLLAIVILLGAVFFTVNSALQTQNAASHASTSNILSNPGCESGTSSFIGYQASISTVSSPVHSGSASCKVVSTGGSFYDIIATDVYPNPQRGQTFSGYAYVRANSNTGGLVYVAMQEWNGSTLVKTTYGNSVSLMTNWQLVTNTTTMSSSGTRVVFYVVQNPGSGGQSFYADDMYFGAGSLPNPTTAPLSPVPTTVLSLAPSPTSVPTATPTPTEMPTPMPFVDPTPTPTPTPTIAVTPSTTPSTVVVSPSPTPTPIPGDTTLNFVVGLHGIGTAGDSADPNSDGNMNPLHPTRTVTITVFDSQNNQITSQQGNMTYNSSTGQFDGSVDLGSSFATGFYTVKVQTSQYLRGLVPGIQAITSGQVNTLPYIALVAGDINGDNQINILDYNILMGCYSDLLPAVNCTAANQVLSDLNDDGNVNQFDYNLFLRELSTVSGN